MINKRLTAPCLLILQHTKKCKVHWYDVCFAFDKESAVQYIMQAWEEDPLDTLKLIAHLRDVRDGKADQNLFHDCIVWLCQEHPLLANLDEIVKVAIA